MTRRSDLKSKHLPYELEIKNMKYLKYILILLAGTSLLFTGCEDDDNDNNGDVVDTVDMSDADAAVDMDGAETVDPEPLGADNKPSVGTQLDRVGRPAITTALIGTFLSDEDQKNTLKDDYNTAAPADWSGFADNIALSLAILDGLDTVCGNQLLAAESVSEDRYSTLAGSLATDVLLIDSTDTDCSTYLGVEAELFVDSVDDGGCGGRIPTADVVDASYTVLAAGGLDQSIGDNVDSDDGGANNDTFPFFGAPSN
jgi:hypothetical protein